MIQESDHGSPFFKRNKEELISLIYPDSFESPTVSGWCNAFGYEIQCGLHSENYLIYSKIQQSNQDPLIPKNARDQYLLEVILDLGFHGRFLMDTRILAVFYKEKLICGEHTIHYQDVPAEVISLICELIEVIQPSILRFRKGRFKLVARHQIENLQKTIQLLNQLIILGTKK